MRRFFCFLILIIATSAIFNIVAKAKEELKAPPGMEVIEISGVRYIVPQGSEVRKKGGLIILEGHNEYVARRFLEFEQRIEAIEKKIEDLQNITTGVEKE